VSIRVLVSGRLCGKPELRTGKTGNPFTTAKLSIDTGEEHRTWASCIAFGKEAERLAGLKNGDAVSVAGRAKLEAYEARDGAPKALLSIVVDEIAAVRRKR
jgi:single-stranded DNA-binding protein